MRRRLAGLFLAAGLAAGLVAGCGIPDHTEVKVEGAGRAPGFGEQASTARIPKDRPESDTPTELVTDFLSAPAGEFGDTRTMRRMQTYVSQDKAPTLSLKSGAAVVQMLSPPRFVKDSEVELTVRHLGVLSANGEMLPPINSNESVTYTIGVAARPNGEGYEITSPPENVTLLDYDALINYYRQCTVYFWNIDRTALVPDLRWLPQEIGDSRVPTELLRMIESGPSQWLDGFAEPLPDTSKLLINAPIDGGKLTMNWSPAAVLNDTSGGDYLAQQVAWTLASTGGSPESLELKINGQVKDDFDTATLLTRTAYPVGPTETAYALLDGKVRGLTGDGGAVPPPLLGGAADQAVHSAAAIHTDGQLLVAVVNKASGALQVGTSPNGPVTALKPVNGISPDVPPVWLPRSKIGLAVDGGVLHTFGADGSSVTIEPKNAESGITALAAAPDGQRIALVANKRLFVVPVGISSDGGLRLTAGPAREIVAPLEDPTAVAWSGETTLSVGGSVDGQPKIGDVTIDGARRFPRVENARGRVSTIAAYPENVALRSAGNPELQRTGSTVIYQADNLTWLARSDTQLTRSAVVGEPPDDPNAPNQNPPTVPFYVF